MPTYFLLRIASILASAVIVIRSPDQKTWIFIVYSLAFAHYVVALIYSRRQIVEGFRQPYSLVPLVSIAIVTLGLYFGQFSLLYYFALHHAFNEAFLLSRTLPQDNEEVKAFRSSAVLVHLFLYFFILRGQAGFTLGPSSPFYSLLATRTGGNRYLLMYLLAGGFAVSYGIYFYYLFRIRRLLTVRTFIENCGSELLGLFVAAMSIGVYFSYLHFVMYHVVFWSFFPIPKIWAQGRMELARYLGLTVVCTAGFLLLSPLGLLTSRFASAIFQRQFILWTYVHITSSFLLSNAHPEWIVNLFRPKAAALAKA